MKLTSFSELFLVVYIDLGLEKRDFRALDFFPLSKPVSIILACFPCMVFSDRLFSGSIFYFQVGITGL